MVYAITFASILSLVASTAVLAAPRSGGSHTKRFDEYSILEERATLPRRWTRSTVTGPLRRRMEAKESFNLPLRINLAQSNVDKAHDILMDISHPESPRYSDHLSPHEVASLVCFWLAYPVQSKLKLLDLRSLPPSQKLLTTSSLGWPMQASMLRVETTTSSKVLSRSKCPWI